MAPPRGRALTSPSPSLNWSSGDAYEPYVGRWSRLVARDFVGWLGVPRAARWLDVGCGTGALTATILSYAEPSEVHGVEPSEGFLEAARRQVRDARARFKIGDARSLPLDSDAYDAVVSGLVLNFIPDTAAGVREMVRVARPSGTVAAYVWDYAGKMELMRHFWDAVVALKPADRHQDEGVRFPICGPGPLGELFRQAGLRDVQTRAVDVPTHFRDFDDYWSPFLGGQGPAPGYAVALSEADRTTLRERIRASLPIEANGSISLIARAWAVRGRKQRGP